MMETIKVNLYGKDFEFRKSISITEYCANVDAVAHAVVSDAHGYQPQIRNLSIAMTMMRLYAIGWEDAKAEEVWELMSEGHDPYPYEAPEAGRFCEDCEAAIAYLRDRSPFAAFVDSAKNALMNMGKEDPELLMNVVKMLKEVAGSAGGDMT